MCPSRGYFGPPSLNGSAAVSSPIVFALTTSQRDYLATLLLCRAAYPNFNPDIGEALAKRSLVVFEPRHRPVPEPASAMTSRALAAGVPQLTQLGESAARLALALVRAKATKTAGPVIFQLTAAQRDYLAALDLFPSDLPASSELVGLALARKALVTFSPKPALTPVGKFAAALARLLVGLKGMSPAGAQSVPADAPARATHARLNPLVSTRNLRLCPKTTG